MVLEYVVGFVHELLNVMHDTFGLTGSLMLCAVLLGVCLQKGVEQAFDYHIDRKLERDYPQIRKTKQSIVTPTEKNK